MEISEVILRATAGTMICAALTAIACVVYEWWVCRKYHIWTVFRLVVMGYVVWLYVCMFHGCLEVGDVGALLGRVGNGLLVTIAALCALREHRGC